eukprot:jgi/Botrbrau1/10810/Bobra.0064s0016.1
MIHTNTNFRTSSSDYRKSNQKCLARGLPDLRAPLTSNNTPPSSKRPPSPALAMWVAATQLFCRNHGGACVPTYHTLVPVQAEVFWHHCWIMPGSTLPLHVHACSI